MHEDQYFSAVWGRPALVSAGSPLPEWGGALGAWGNESPLDGLRYAVKEFSSFHDTLNCTVRLKSGESAEVFRVRPARMLHVVGASRLAAELRRLISAGAEPDWELHPVPGGRTPLHALAAPLRRLTGSSRTFNLLDRSGFAYVEEVAATPDECLMDLRGGGPKFVATLRQVISQLEPEAVAEAPALDGREPGARPPVIAPGTLRAVQIAAAWAVAEAGARTAGDLSRLASLTRKLPPDVAAAWDHIRQLDLRQIAGHLLAGDADLAGLAAEMLAEVDRRRQLILTTHTFAPPPRRTYDSLAAELGISRERVRQLEDDALGKLAQAAYDDRYAPLRWRAAAASSGTDAPLPAGATPAWIMGLLGWLSRHAR